MEATLPRDSRMQIALNNAHGMRGAVDVSCLSHQIIKLFKLSCPCLKKAIQIDRAKRFLIRPTIYIKSIITTAQFKGLRLFWQRRPALTSRLLLTACLFKQAGRKRLYFSFNLNFIELPVDLERTSASLTTMICARRPPYSETSWRDSGFQKKAISWSSQALIQINKAFK